MKFFQVFFVECMDDAWMMHCGTRKEHSVKLILACGVGREATKGGGGGRREEGVAGEGRIVLSSQCPPSFIPLKFTMESIETLQFPETHSFISLISGVEQLCLTRELKEGSRGVCCFNCLGDNGEGRVVALQQQSTCSKVQSDRSSRTGGSCIAV